MSISCIRCNYAITEPLCASCVINEVRIWFYEKSVRQKIVRRINKKLKNILKIVNSLNYAISPFEEVPDESVMRCIKCKNGMHLMCLYCVSHQASQVVRNNLRSKIMTESFEESFNTNLYYYELNKNKDILQPFN